MRTPTLGDLAHLRVRVSVCGYARVWCVCACVRELVMGCGIRGCWE
jgi:hypothetical protein